MRHPSLALSLFPALALAACGPTVTAGLAGPGEIGYSCSTASDCTQVSDAMCLQMSGGYCAKDCGTLGQLDCPSEAVCHHLSDQADYCLDGCLSSADCRAGYRCLMRPDLADMFTSGVGVCVPACTSDAECPSGQSCNRASGDCVSRVGSNAGVGTPCSANNGCNSGFCIAIADFPGGYCSSPCGGHLGSCEPGSDCYQLESGSSFCLAVCTRDAECRDGYGCTIVEQGGDLTKGFCVPPFTGTPVPQGCGSAESCGAGDFWD